MFHVEHFPRTEGVMNDQEDGEDRRDQVELENPVSGSGTGLETSVVIGQAQAEEKQPIVQPVRSLPRVIAVANQK